MACSSPVRCPAATRGRRATILAPPHPAGGLAGIFVFEQQVLVTQDGCEVLSGALPARLWEVGA